MSLNRIWMACAAAIVAGLASAAVPATAAVANHRVVAYYQTQYSNGAYVSPLPLNGIATDIEVAALHLNNDGSVHLNDDPPSAAKFTQMWRDLATLQRAGLRVSVMLGGAAQGSYANLHNNFAKYYGLLKSVIQTYHLNGVDIDIEETFSLADTKRLIGQLRTDFGGGFIVTLAPVATDLSGSSRFSGGFSYEQLETEAGSKISWYNAQFYCGWGSLSSTSNYKSVINAGFAPAKVVAGTVTNPANCSGYVPPSTLTSTIRSLVASYPSFGGVAGWEYFNSTAVGSGGPESWYRNVKTAMR